MNFPIDQETTYLSPIYVYPYDLSNTSYSLYMGDFSVAVPSSFPSDVSTWQSWGILYDISNNYENAINSNISIGNVSLNNIKNGYFSFPLYLVTTGNKGNNNDKTFIAVDQLFVTLTSNYIYNWSIIIPVTFATYAAPTITNISPSTSSSNPYTMYTGETIDISFTITQDPSYNSTNLYNSTLSEEYTDVTVETILNNYLGSSSTTTITPNTGYTLASMKLGWESTNSNTKSYTIKFKNTSSTNSSLGWNVSTSLTPTNFNYEGISNQGVSNTAYFYYQTIDPAPSCDSISKSIYPNRITGFNLPVSAPEGITYNWQIYDIVGGGSYNPSSGAQQFYSSQPDISFTTPSMSTTINKATYDVSNSEYNAAGSNNIQFTIVPYNRPSISFPNNITSYYLYTGQTIDISVNVIVDSNITTASAIGSTNYKQVELSGNIQTQGTYGTLTVPSFPKAVIDVSTVNVPDISYTAYQSPNTDSVSFFYIDTFNQNVTDSTGYTKYSTLTMNIVSGTPVVSTNTTSNSYPNRDVSFSITSKVAALNGTYPPYLEYSFNQNTNISPQSLEISYNDVNNNYPGNFSYILPNLYYNTLNSYDTSYIVTNPLGNSDNSGNISFNITPYTTPTFDSSLQTYTVLAGETLSIPFQVSMSQAISSAGSNYNKAQLSGTIITQPTLGTSVLNTQTYYPFPITSPIIYDISYIAGTTLGSDSFIFNIQDTFNKDVTDSSGNTGDITLNIIIKNPTQVSDMLIDCSENTGTNNSTSQVYMDLSANDGSGYYPLSMIIKTVPLNGNLYYKSNSDSSFNKVIQGGITIGQMTDANTYNFELYYQGNLYYYGSDSFTWYAKDNESFSSSIATNTISIQYVNVSPTAISYDVSLVSYYGITDISKGTPVELPYTAVNRSLSDLSFILQSYSSDISYATLTKELITYIPYKLPEVNLSDTGGYEKNNVGVIDNRLVNLDISYGFSFNIKDPSGATSNTASVGVYMIPYLEDTGIQVIENGSGNIYLNTEYTYLTNNGTGYTFSYYIKSNVSNGKLTYNGSPITTNPFITTQLSLNSESQLGLPILYTANNNYTGNDSFTWYISYTNINDGYTATSNIATVTINIPEYEYPPVAENKTYTIKLK